MAVDEQPRRAPLDIRRALCPTRLFICPPSAVHRLASCRSGYVRVYAKAAVLSRASNRTAEPSSDMERGASSLKHQGASNQDNT